MIRRLCGAVVAPGGIIITVGVCEGGGGGAVVVSSLVGDDGGLDSRIPDSFNKSARLTPLVGLELLLPVEDPCTLLFWMDVVVMMEG